MGSNRIRKQVPQRRIRPDIHDSINSHVPRKEAAYSLQSKVRIAAYPGNGRVRSPSIGSTARYLPQTPCVRPLGGALGAKRILWFGGQVGQQFSRVRLGIYLLAAAGTCQAGHAGQDGHAGGGLAGTVGDSPSRKFLLPRAVRFISCAVRLLSIGRRGQR